MEEKIMDINNKFVSEFLDPLRERAKNQRNEELSIERTKNIYQTFRLADVKKGKCKTSD